MATRTRRSIVLAALAAPAARALATDFSYTGPVDLAATPYTPADRIYLDNATASASAPVTTLASVVHFTTPSTIAGSQDITLAGTLGGAGFTKAGTATLTLAGDSPDYLGAVTLDAGTLRLGSPDALGTTPPYATYGPGDVYLNPGGTFDLNGFTVPRLFRYNGGALVNDNAAVPVSFPVGGSVGGTPVLGGAGNITFNAALAGTSFTKIGPGTVTLAASSGNYYGPFYVNGGTLRFTSAGGLGNANNDVYLNPSGTVDLNGLVPARKRYNFAGGALANDNTATPVTLNGNNFLAVGGSTTGPAPSVYIGGAGDIVLDIPLPTPGVPLVKTGAGTLTLNQSPSTGGAQVLAGTLRLGAADALPHSGTTTVLPGGALDVNGFSIPAGPVSLAGGAYVNNNTATPVTVTSIPSLVGPDLRFGGAGDMTLNFGFASSSFSLTKVGTGTLTLTTPSSHTGGTNLLAGTTVLGANADSLLGASQVPLAITDGLLRNTNSSGLSRPVTLLGSAGGFDTPFPFTLTRPISGTGALHKYGSSTLTIASSLTAGTLAVHEGSVVAQGNVVLSSLSVSPGAAFSLTPTRMFIDVPPDAPLPLDSVRSLLSAGRHGGDWAGTGGITSIRFGGPGDPAHTHAFAYADGALLPDSLRQIGPTTFLDTSSVVIRYTLYGDANLDLKLNADDYALLDRAYARSTANAHWTDGDFNYDGTVDQNDYLLIDSAYLQQQGGTPSPAFLAQRESRFGAAYVADLLTSVPEPSSAACLFVGFFLARRRRRRPTPRLSPPSVARASRPCPRRGQLR